MIVMTASSFTDLAHVEVPSFTRLALIDDHSIVHAIFKNLIESNEHFELTWCAKSLCEATLQLQNDLPNLLILGVSLPDGDGLDYARNLKHEYPELHIIILSMYGDETSESQAIEMGATGYIPQNATAQEVLEILEKVTQDTSLAKLSV